MKFEGQSCLVIMAVGLLCASTFAAKAKAPRFPNEIRADLTRHAGNWRFAASQTSEGRKCITRVAGDLDGNGQIDYAVYIQAGKGASEKRQRLIVYLQQDGGYVRRTLDRSLPASDLCLYLFQKGRKDYNYETQRHFRYRHATVGLFSEKGGYSYLYRRGRFYRTITSD
ncbi:MAG: hypothetical protein HYR56_01145 [Acidobacteria bacterium]|nr:hypothetical protein [Acidobacteriota bacterium]MBI3426903.1 hypothetical protein [Acidobacteriota bacterium]